MANSKLLKEAIADAKAVKETALANAKLALEEAFTPRLQSILSQKLRAEAEEESDDQMQTEELDSSDIGTADSSGKTPGKVPALDADTELAQGMKKSTAKKGLEDPNRTIVNDLMEGDEDEMGGDEKDKEIAELRARLAELEGEEETPETEEEGMYSEEGDDMEMGDEDGEDYEITGDEEESNDDEDDMDLESIIRELEAQMSEEESTDDSTDEEPTMESYSDGSEAGTDKGEDPKVVMTTEAEEEDDKEATDEVIDLEEILREMEADMKDDESKNEAEEKEESDKLKTELNEAYDTIKSLRSTINEVNLLNAKLLFANKLFRAHNMTNEQKVKVIETLDRTKSVREVKLVYATLAENLKPAPSNKTAKKSISEGLASKVVKSTKPAAAPKQVIAESTDFADRFKKLAGIIK